MVVVVVSHGVLISGAKIAHGPGRIEVLERATLCRQPQSVQPFDCNTATKTPIMRTVPRVRPVVFLSILAQDCEGQHTFTVVIQPDAWPYEMSWS